MSSLFATLVVLVLAASCGKLESQRANTLVQSTSYSNSPIGLVKQKKTCEKNSGNFLYDLHLFLSGEISTERDQDFSDLFPAGALKKNPAISRITFGEKTEVSFSDVGMTLRQWQSPEDFYVCPEQPIYFRGSVESAGLNASRFIYDTFKVIRRALPDLALAPVEVSISPLLIRSIVEKQTDGSLRKKSAYMTDNAFYSPETASITILPHSRELRDQGIGLNFWELPMVASHEYGHHVFQLLFRNHTRTSIHGCFGPESHNPSPLKSVTSRSVSIDDVVNAYNEGFADLVSYYSLAPKLRAVEHVPCLRVTRDVKSPVLFNGRRKVFDEAALRTFFSSRDQRKGSCDDPGLQDVHVLGAIFAHNADSFLSELTESRFEKLAALAEWVKFLRTQRKTDYPALPRSYLKATFSEFLRISLRRFGATVDRRLCQNIDRMYPGLELAECRSKKES